MSGHTPEVSAQTRVKLAEIRRAVRELRQVHHMLRHPHVDGCVECVMLAWLKDEGF